MLQKCHVIKPSSNQNNNKEEAKVSKREKRKSNLVNYR